MNRKYILPALALCALAACKPNLDPEKPSAGDADFSRYVSVGNSLTAGYADGTLYRTGQQNSYPAMLAAQFRLVGGGDFKIPLLPGDYGWPDPKFVLAVAAGCDGIPGITPVPNTAAPDTSGSSISVAAQGPFNNTGVPGIRCIDYLAPGYPALNPYSRRFFQDLSATPLREINRIPPTFFTCWVGNNDVLGYATSGGAGKGSDGGLLDANSISSLPLFSIAFDSIMNRMTAGGAKGVVIGIPDVTAIPYFTTVPSKVVLSQGLADTLNAAYAGTGITFGAGANGWVIEDTTVPLLKMRKMVDGELLLLTLPQDSLKCAHWGTAKPIPSEFVLDLKEIGNIRTATLAFNQIMQSRADELNLAYVDIGSYLSTVASGITFNGVTFNTTFVSGGAFSLDGVHLTPRGYALVANEIIRHINAKYHSTIPEVDVNAHSGLHLP